MKIVKQKYLIGSIGGLILLISLLTSCKKREIIGVDPYSGGKSPLGIKFVDANPDPEIGVQGGIVNIKILGLEKYTGKFKFFINETESEILSLTDSTVNVKIPDNASTGGLSVVLDGQTFFGPNFSIVGKVSIDKSFLIVNGANKSIYDILRLPNNNYFLTGSFDNFENKATPSVPIGAIAQVSAQGAYQTSLNFGKAANGAIYNVNRLTNGQYILSGQFGAFNGRSNINNITRLNSDGTLDTTIINVINPTPLDAKKNIDTIPSFNGGVDGTIRKTFLFNDQLFLVGNFKNYAKYFYDRSTHDNKILDITKMNQLVKLNTNGTMDSTYNFDLTTKSSSAGGNGNINDAIIQGDGKLIIVGSFSTFNGSPANHIARINTDGTLDKTFNIGSGANDDITSITYNSVTKKIMIAGVFLSYNGAPKLGVAMLNSDGTLDNSFSFNELKGGVPSFAAQLNNGKIIVSGSFNQYGNTIRQGFMILDANGTLVAGYNNTGAFQGQIYKMIETTSSFGNPAVILVGRISKFDNKPIGNIVRVEIKN